MKTEEELIIKDAIKLLHNSTANGLILFNSYYEALEECHRDCIRKYFSKDSKATIHIGKLDKSLKLKKLLIVNKDKKSEFDIFFDDLDKITIK